MKRYVAGCAIMLCVLAIATPANAQANFTPRFEISGGVTELNHEASGLHRNGTHGQIAVGLPFRTFLSDDVRLEFGYHSIPGKPSPAMTIPNAGLVVVDLALLKRIVRTEIVMIDALGGAGSYRMDQGSGRESHFGINAGGRISVPIGTHRAFADARFHQVFTGEPNGFWPISLGFQF